MKSHGCSTGCFLTKQIQDDFGPARDLPEVERSIEEYIKDYHGRLMIPYLDKVLDVIDPKTIMTDSPHAMYVPKYPESCRWGSRASCDEILMISRLVTRRGFTISIYRLSCKTQQRTPRSRLEVNLGPNSVRRVLNLSMKPCSH